MSDTKMQLYLDMMSQPCRAVVMLCKEAGVSFDTVPVRIQNGDTKSKEFRAVHAAGKVPVLVDGDFTLGESHAIMAYIVRTKCSRGMAERWYPSASKVRARIDEWMHWHHSNLRRGASSTLMYTMGLAEARGLHPDGAAVEEKILRSALRHMNSALTGAKFLAGTELATVADLSAAAELSMLELVPTRFIDEPQFSAVKAWYDRMQRLESWGPAHAVLYKVVAKLRGSRL